MVAPSISAAGHRASIPLVSVILPWSEFGKLAEESVESIRNQSTPSFEVLLLVDSELDRTSKPTESVTPPPFRVIETQSAAPETAKFTVAITEARGEYVAFMKPGDRLRRDKLERHIEALREHPNVGATVGGSVILDRLDRPRTINSVPEVADPMRLLPELPFGLADTVIRKDHLINSGLAGSRSPLMLEDVGALLWLRLSGCRFRGLDCPLTERRIEPPIEWSAQTLRRYKLGDRALVELFQDPRVGRDYRSIRYSVLALRTLRLALAAFLADDIAAGQQLVRTAIRQDHSLIEDSGRRLLVSIVHATLWQHPGREGSVEAAITRLPKEFQWLSKFTGWAKGYAYFWLGVWSALWGRAGEAELYSERLGSSEFSPDKGTLDAVLQLALRFSREVGAAEADLGVRGLIDWLEEAIGPRVSRHLASAYYVNRAFREYKSGEYMNVRRNILRAWKTQPGVLANRGVRAVLARSVVSPRRASSSSA